MMEVSDLLDVHTKPSEVSDFVKAGLSVQCPARGCSDRSMNYVCYDDFLKCPFYQAYLRQLEFERIESVKLKRGYQR